MHSEHITTVGWCSWYAQRTCSFLKFIFSKSPLLQQANTNSPVVFKISASPVRLVTRSSPPSLPRFESVQHVNIHIRIPLKHDYVAIENNSQKPIVYRCLRRKQHLWTNSPLNTRSTAPVCQEDVLYGCARTECSLSHQTPMWFHPTDKIESEKHRSLKFVCTS